MDSDLFLQGGTAALFVKIMVDGARMILPRAPGWVFPLIALGLAPACLLAMMALGDPIVINQQFYARWFLGSIACFGTAVGLTEAQKRADAVRAAA